MWNCYTKYLTTGLAVTLWTFGVSLVGMAQSSSSKPTLPLSMSVGAAPFLANALQDPSVANDVPTREIEAERLVIELKEYQNDLKRAKGMRYRELVEQLFEGYLLLSYHMSDMLSGLNNTTHNLHSASQNLTSIRSVFINYAKQHSSFQKNGSKKDRILYHLYVTRYLMGYKPQLATSQLKKLKYLPGTLKRRVQLIAAIENSKTSRSAQLDKAHLELSQLAKTLTRVGAITARLTAARAAAGLNHRGKKVSKSQKSYRHLLVNATKSASRFNDTVHNQVLAHSTAIWRRAEGYRASYHNPPLYLKKSAHLNVAKAIKERQSRESWNKGQFLTAAKGYEDLSDSFRGHPLAWSMDQRLLAVRADQYRKTSKTKYYEDTLNRLQKRYEYPQALGNGNEQKVATAHKLITDRYRNLVSSQLQLAKRLNTKSWLRNQAIALGERYILAQQDGAAKEDITVLLAQAYTTKKDRAKAVDLYMDLAANGTADRKHQYLRMAINQQTHIAQWPSKVNWRQVAKSNQKSRTALLEMYEQLAQIDSQKINWSDTAHRGLLMRNLGKDEEAFTTWQNAIDVSPRHSYAAVSAGIMIADLERQADWSSLEKIARVAIKHNLKPTHKKTTYSPKKVLGVALYQGGKSSLADQRFAAAAEKLREFVNDYPTHQNRDDAVFKLANAYRGNAQHPESLETMMLHVTEYPRSPLRSRALIHGGNWAQEAADEEQAIYFQSQFLREFMGHKQSPAISQELLSLYLGKGMYAQAIALHESLAQRQRGEARLETWSEIMNLEFRFGNVDKAVRYAHKIEKIASKSSDIRAEALMIRARHSIGRQNLQALSQIENALSDMQSDSLTITEGLGEIRFQLAMHYSKDAVKEVFNLELVDPLRTLNELNQQFEKASSKFEQVCEIPSSYCPGANHSVARIAEQVVTSMQSITINDSLPEDEVNIFQTKKAALIDGIMSLAKNKDRKALADVRNGNSQPDWTMQVLWHNTSDWNFDRITGEMGNAYIQHEPVGHQSVNYLAD